MKWGGATVSMCVSQRTGARRTGLLLPACRGSCCPAHEGARSPVQVYAGLELVPLDGLKIVVRAREKGRRGGAACSSAARRADARGPCSPRTSTRGGGRATQRGAGLYFGGTSCFLRGAGILLLDVCADTSCPLRGYGSRRSSRYCRPFRAAPAAARGSGALWEHGGGQNVTNISLFRREYGRRESG
jgi:hypothetical protein